MWDEVPKGQFLERARQAHTAWMYEVDFAYDRLDPADREHCLNQGNRLRWFHGQPADWP